MVRNVGPEGRKVDPEGRKVCPEGRKVGPEGRKVSPEGRKVCTECRKVGPEGRKVDPEGQEVCPDGHRRRKVYPGRQKIDEEHYGVVRTFRPPQKETFATGLINFCFCTLQGRKNSKGGLAAWDGRDQARSGLIEESQLNSKESKKWPRGPVGDKTGKPGNRESTIQIPGNDV
eukprot:gene13355-biopygen14088